MELLRFDLGRMGFERADVQLERAPYTDDILIRVRLRGVYNADRPDDDKKTWTNLAKSIPEGLPPEHICQMVRAAVIQALTHEVDEWLRCDGLRVTDPHPELDLQEVTA